MREIEIFVMIKMLILFTVVGLPTPHIRFNKDSDEVVSRTERNLYQEREFQVHNLENSQHCADPEYKRSFVIEPDLRGDQ